MKKLIPLFFALFLFNNCFAQVDYGSCDSVPSGSPCFFGLYSFWITQVHFGTLNFTGGTCADATDNGYQNLYNAISGNVSADSTYTFSVSRSGSSGGGYFSAWVDWNNDGDFNDTLEQLFTVTGSVGPTTRTFSVTVPSNAVAGDHRLRVRSDGSDPGGNPNPCATTGPYGDTKDFKITVKGNSTCSVSIIAPFDHCSFGCTGTLIAEPGGTAPFTYLWSPSMSTDSVIRNVCTGTYTVSIRDSSGCSASDTITIHMPDSIKVTATVKGISFINCDSMICGSIDILTTGGTPGYTYFWNTGSTIQNLDCAYSGQYCVAVTDTNGCMIDTCFIIPAPPPPVVLTLTTDSVLPSCNGCNDGLITAHASGGQPPYYFSWFPPISGDSVASGLTEGVYIVCVTDINGCTVCDTVNLVRPLFANEVFQKALFSVYPDPVKDILYIKFTDEGEFTVNIYNAFGEPIKSSLGLKQLTSLDIRDLAQGVYFLRVTSQKSSLTREFVKEY